MLKCRSRLHWITSKGLLLSVHLDHSKKLRSVSLSQSHSYLQTCLCKTNRPQLSFTTDLIGKKMEVVVSGSFRPFISSLRTRGVQMQFSCCCFFLDLLARKNLVAIFSYNFYYSPCTGEFSRLFVGRKSLHKTGFFPREKSFSADFFFEVEKPSAEIPREISAKMQKTGSTVEIVK